ncbi:hypothetical protein B5M09_004444 [Aphanomyces astaci]|uniref:Mechanosensitive ion channel MscS domain-containing protein n=1 Tax=Aphanomyces astaci TaxID=112090 RepID=A0A425DCZ6_APHAT|nr:hypothetical protein B5M09_004444 [Aphanomyces astaci]
MLKYVLGAVVFYYFFFNQLDFSTTEVFTTMVLLMEVLFVLSSHTWFRNVMGGLVLLIDEPIKSGNHVQVLGHAGVVEHMYLQYFTLRQYDKGLAFIPNGVVFHHTMDVHAKSQHSCFRITIPLSPATSAAATRAFVRDADCYLAAAASSARGEAAAPLSSVRGLPPPDKRANPNFTLAVKALTRSSLFSKPTAAASAIDPRGHLDSPINPSRFWIALTDLHTIEVVYFFAPNMKFRHVVEQKQKR